MRKWPSEIEMLRTMRPEDAATQIGTELLIYLFPVDPNLTADKALKWSEIRENIRQGGLKGYGNGYTLLHACAEYGSEETVQRLVELGANVNALDRPNGDSPLGRAVIAHRGGKKIPEAVSRILLENGADVG